MIIQIALVIMLIFVLISIWKNSIPIDGIDRNLLKATQGEREAARSLLIRARAKYPEKSQKWHVQKAIDDLNCYRNANVSMDNRQANENCQSELDIDRTTL